MLQKNILVLDKIELKPNGNALINISFFCISFLKDKMFYIRMMLALLVFITILVFFALFLGFSQATEIEEVQEFKSIKTQNVTGTKFS